MDPDRRTLKRHDNEMQHLGLDQIGREEGRENTATRCYRDDGRGGDTNRDRSLGNNIDSVLHFLSVAVRL